MSTSTRLLRLPDVEAQTGLKKSSLYRLEAQGRFPARVKLSERATAWRESDINEWIAQRMPVEHRPPAAAVA